jgi:hypothetical protein
MGTFFESLKLGQQRQGADRDYQLNRRMLDIARRQSRGGGSPNYSAYAQGLASANQNIYG